MMTTTLHKSVVTCCKSAPLILLLIYLILFVVVGADDDESSSSDNNNNNSHDVSHRRTTEEVVTSCFDDDESWLAKLLDPDENKGEEQKQKQEDDPFDDDLILVVHRNGEGTPCGEMDMRSSSNLLVQALQETFQDKQECPTKEAVLNNNNMYEMESILTRVLHRTIQSCNASVGTDDDESDDHPDHRHGATTSNGFFGYCDMGKAHTPILEDHSQLVPNYVYSSSSNKRQQQRSSFLPCHFHTKAGVRLSSFSHLVHLARQAEAQSPRQDTDEATTTTATTATKRRQRRELHLYAVQAGRYFMFAPSYAGEIIDLPHIQGGDPQQPVYLQVLSVQPRVFDIINFMHPISEGQELLANALQETRDDLKLQRSATGEAGHVVVDRTSDTGWDTDSRVSQTLKNRCFDVLGMGNYSDSDFLQSQVEGLQTLRYNLTTAYIPHLDYFETLGRPSYDSTGLGSNRFATILLYLNDLEPQDGGETVFVAAGPMGQTREEQVDLDTSIRQLRASGTAQALEPGSWEEQLAAKCRIRLTVRPRRGRAVLFYSQLPDGQYDPYSNHAACPVLQGTKFAANLWIWNGPRPED